MKTLKLSKLLCHAVFAVYDGEGRQIDEAVASNFQWFPAGETQEALFARMETVASKSLQEGDTVVPLRRMA